LFDQLLTDAVSGLVHEGLADLCEVAQDGVRVRACAGSSSFRRPATLAECRAAAEKHLAALAAEDHSGRGPAARKRAAAERAERVTRAIAAAEQLAQERSATAPKSGRTPREPRASTTDPDARRMTMADGGTRPAYNVQLATTSVGGLIVGVDVTAAGTDHGQLGPMVDQVQRRFGVKPERMLADGGFAQLADIEALHPIHVDVYAPVKTPTNPAVDPHVPKPTDGPGVASWRTRMGTAAARRVYRGRVQTAEWVNARLRNWGLRQFVVRGLTKVRAVATLFALTHNLIQGERLRRLAAA
jgi:hypothetical protein